MTSRTIEMEPTTDINSLPVDVIVTIFKLLSREDRKKLSLVNKRLLEIYKYQSGFKFAFVLDLHSDLKKAGDGIKLLREKCPYPYDQLTISCPESFDSFQNVTRAVIYCQQISDLKDSIARVAAQRVEYIVFNGGRLSFMVFQRLLSLFPHLKSVGFVGFIIHDPCDSAQLWDCYAEQLEGLLAPSVKELVVFKESLCGFSQCINHLLALCPNIEKIIFIREDIDDQEIKEVMPHIHQEPYRSVERTFEVAELCTSRLVIHEWNTECYICLFSLLQRKQDYRIIYRMAADDIEKRQLSFKDNDVPPISPFYRVSIIGD